MALGSTFDISRPESSRSQYQEELSHKIEERAAQVPSVSFISLAVASMVGSAILAFFTDKKDTANFIGMWAPSFLLMGVYNKLIRIEHSEDTPSSARRAA